MRAELEGAGSVGLMSRKFLATEVALYGAQVRRDVTIFREMGRTRDTEDTKTKLRWGWVTISFSHTHEGSFGGTLKYMAVHVRDFYPCIDRAWASAGTVRPTCFTKACGCHCEGADDEYQNGRFSHHAAHGTTGDGLSPAWDACKPLTLSPGHVRRKSPWAL